ncbi:MAG: sulfite exporter TauE/SafE family protein [Verrucomicrobiota bacterium]
MNFLIAGLVGLVSGIASGLFGVGGGIVMVPAMMFFMNVPIKTAVGTSIILTALMGTYKHFSQGNVDRKIALSLGPMAIIGGFSGAWLTTIISADNLKKVSADFWCWSDASVSFQIRTSRVHRETRFNYFQILAPRLRFASPNLVSNKPSGLGTRS